MGEIDRRLLDVWAALRQQHADEREAYEPATALLHDVTHLRLHPRDGVVIPLTSIGGDDR